MWSQPQCNHKGTRTQFWQLWCGWFVHTPVLLYMKHNEATTQHASKIVNKWKMSKCGRGGLKAEVEWGTTTEMSSSGY